MATDCYLRDRVDTVCQNLRQGLATYTDQRDFTIFVRKSESPFS